MKDFTLYIGTKNISSWSLRAWLMLTQIGIDFETVLIELDQSDTKEKIMQISPSCKVPLLKHNDHLVWDSLAIGEYLAEIFPEKQLWPADLLMRSKARSISSEMHSGFTLLRKHLSMNIKARINNHLIPEDAQNDIQRIFNVWEECRKQNALKGDFLFGHFTIADAMFGPVVTRFITYDVRLPSIIEEYAQTIIQLPAMKEWCETK